MCNTTYDFQFIDTKRFYELQLLHIWCLVYPHYQEYSLKAQHLTLLKREQVKRCTNIEWNVISEQSTFSPFSLQSSLMRPMSELLCFIIFIIYYHYRKYWMLILVNYYHEIYLEIVNKT